MKLSYLIFTVSIDLYIRGDNNQFSVFCGLFFRLSPALACHGYGYIRFKKEYLRRNIIYTVFGQLAFVITDGNQTTSKPYTKLSVASQGMKNKGVTVYALGVGNKAARAELLEISSGPQYVFSSSSFEELQKLVSLLTREFCEDRLTITTTGNWL